VDGALDRATDLFDREWFGQVVVSAVLHCGDGILGSAVGRHLDNNRRLAGFLDFPEELQAVHLGHPPIAKHEVEVADAFDQPKRLGAAFRAMNLIVEWLQSPDQTHTDVSVVDDQQFRHRDAFRREESQL
jgi:hypothetical protein